MKIIDREHNTMPLSFWVGLNKWEPKAGPKLRIQVECQTRIGVLQQQQKDINVVTPRKAKTNVGFNFPKNNKDGYQEQM